MSEALLHRVRRRLLPPPLGTPGALRDAAAIPAAVLVPLLQRGEQLSVLLTVRAATLADHAGHISLPGGRIDVSDRDPVGAALRETWEEVGIESGRIEVLGCLPAVLTGTGFHVTPVVALVRPPAALRLAAAEVSQAFEVPLGHVLDPANYVQEEAVLRGRSRKHYLLPYQGRRIWGATAAILLSLSGAEGAKRTLHEPAETRA
ncbi:MAG: CoA pyrophosphatase [Alphaproteobacteria bacterium]|nr:CoA pyrophosphatase [Alphaproteobacteria bacterium]MBM4438635.1 CoA pyrophosphatase [Actinomycetota bacterium]